MRYVDYDKSTIAPYPDHNINPAFKDMKWHSDYARAAWLDFSFGVPKGVFANNQGDYERNRMYALGKQPNSQYKKWLGVDQQTLSLIHISEPTRRHHVSRMPSSA